MVSADLKNPRNFRFGEPENTEREIKYKIPTFFDDMNERREQTSCLEITINHRERKKLNKKCKLKNYLRDLYFQRIKTNEKQPGENCNNYHHKLQ